jgi:hypothetical protein
LATFAVKKRLIIGSLLFIISILFPLIGSSQSEKLSYDIISIAEELAADETDPEAVSVFTDKLHDLSENPVKLNTANEEEISRLFFLTDFQAKSITDYIHSSGPILSIYEIANIPGFDKETAEMIIPFIVLENKPVGSSDTAIFRNTIISNFSIKPGNSDTSSLGSNWKILTKYNFTYGRFSGGFTTEKDPGEKFMNGTPPLPDFLSGYLAYKGSGVIRSLIIGDYSARFGQGSNINTGMARGISLISPGYMSASDEIKPYTSSDENRFFRGVATELSLKKFELSLFFSKKYRDATLDSSSGDSNKYIETFYTAGIHNTASLLNRKHNISDVSYGMNFSVNLNNLKLGLTMTGTSFSLPIKITGETPEKDFDFTGSRSNISSVYYNSFIKKILLYGELSVSSKNRLAIIQGISLRPSDRLSINIILRSYSAGFTTFYGRGPGTGSKTTNERGCLGNFTFEAAKHLFISGGCDIEHFPWLKYRCSSPSSGVKRSLQIKYLPTEKLTFDGSYNYQMSVVDSSESLGVPNQNQIVTQSFKGSFRYVPNENLILGTRIDFKIADPVGSKGFLLCEEINFIFKKIPLTIWVRYCLFNTDDWASRIYTYENDLLYSYSIPALSGEGSRSYIMARWKISHAVELRIKYGVTDIITKGNSTETNEIKMQFRIWF